MQALSDQVFPARTFTLRAAAFTLQGMDKSPHIRPIHQIRWRNFRRILESNPGLTITAVALKLDKPQGQVSHFGGKRPTKVIGDQIANEIEVAFQFEPGWLDIDRDSEPFTTPAESSQHRDLRQSRNLRTDPVILAEAVKLVEIDEAVGGKYDHLKHATLLLDLYDRLEAGQDSRELQAKLAYQRVSNQGDSNGTTNHAGAAGSIGGVRK